MHFPFRSVQLTTCRHTISISAGKRLVHSYIPVVDVSALRDDNSSLAARKRVGAELFTAASDVGFFYIKGHAIDEGILTEAIERARFFFERLCDEEKDLLHIRHSHSRCRGYQRLGENVTMGSRDQHEALDLYRDMPCIDGSSSSSSTPIGPTLAGRNTWPSEARLPGFRHHFDEVYVGAMLGLGQSLSRGLALGLGLEEVHLDRFFDRSFWVMRLISYPQPSRSHIGDSDSALGCGAHTDYGCLTILNQDDDPRFSACLEAETTAGNWVPVPHVPGCLAVNVGDMLALWSSDRLRATPHRVMSLPPAARHPNNDPGGEQKSRISVPFFFEPNYDAYIEPLFTDSTSCAPTKPIRYGDHLLEKVSSNFALL